MSLFVWLALCMTALAGGDREEDNDRDGWDDEEDCNDNNPNINPGEKELCDGIDNNCEDGIDEGCDSGDSGGSGLTGTTSTGTTSTGTGTGTSTTGTSTTGTGTGTGTWMDTGIGTTVVITDDVTDDSGLDGPPNDIGTNTDDLNNDPPPRVTDEVTIAKGQVGCGCRSASVSGAWLWFATLLLRRRG